MNKWTKALAYKFIYAFDQLEDKNQQFLLSLLDNSFPPSEFAEHLKKRQRALKNLENYRQVLSQVSQHYPECLSSDDLVISPHALSGYAIMLTAGGEGERLRLSLQKEGYSFSQLHDFNKATFPLPDFYENYGTLQVNLCLVAQLCRDHALDIPVIVTTGPKNSTTARVIPKVLAKYNNFGLQNIRIIQQDERLHFTNNEQLAYYFNQGRPYPVTHPDETGGPIMKLRQTYPDTGKSTLNWLNELGCKKIILLQGTAIYIPNIVTTIASAGKEYDGLGIGIARKSFPADDPYGTYILTRGPEGEKLIIAEQEVRNQTTRLLKNEQKQTYLPYNTGFYVFDTQLVESNELPDYATPPKEVIPELEKSAKIGYAATDIITFAQRPAVLNIPEFSFGVIKKATDLKRLSAIGKKFALDKICQYINNV